MRYTMDRDVKKLRKDKTLNMTDERINEMLDAVRDIASCNIADIAPLYYTFILPN